MRHVKFDVKSEIDNSLISAYIDEAIQNQKEGKEIKVERGQKSPLPISDLLKSNLTEAAIKMLDSLSVGKRNEYIEYIDTAKRLTTKINRMEKILPLLIEGKGLNDKYKKS